MNLSLNFKDGNFIKVSPVGEVVGVDGRSFKIDAKKIVENIKKNGVDIVLDENHNFGGATGWFDKDSFEIRDDGIYAKLELNKVGKELIENKIYRYLSPVYDLSGRDVVAIDSVGLVNKPNLLNTSLNFKGEKMPNKEVETKEEVKEPNKELEALKNEINTLKGEIETLKSKKDEPKQEIDESETTTKELNSRLEKMEQNLETIASFFGKKNLEANSKDTLSESEKKIALMLGLSEDEYKGAK